MNTGGTDRPPLGWRLPIFGMLATPFTVVWAGSMVRRARSAGRSLGPFVDPAWFGWINVAVIVMALSVLIAPFLVERPLRHRRVSGLGGADGRLLLMGVGGAASVSMHPVLLLFLGSGSASWVLPCAAFCFLVQIFWCWRFRHLLLETTR